MTRVRALLTLPLVLGVLACDDGAEPLPAVSWIEVLPADTLLAPGDSLRFEARAHAADGAVLEVPLTFSLTAGSAGEVEEDGLFRATAAGTARVVAAEPRAVRGFAHVRTSPVTGFEPAHAPFGGVVTVHGAGFDTAASVLFGSVPGVVRQVLEDGRRLEAWVPWDAEVGPLSVVLAGGSTVAAPGTFFLTGRGDDALEPNDLARATPVTLPFRNPFLLSRWDDMDHVVFEVTRPRPVSVRVLARDAQPSWADRVVLQVTEADDVEEFLAVAPAWSWVGGHAVEAVVSRERLAPGRYAARIFVPEALGARYELRIDTVASWGAQPDAWEGNDFPTEAPEVSLPFTDTLALENPWSVDYFTVRVGERSNLTVTGRSFGPRLGVFLHDGERSVHWHLSNGTRAHTWRGAIGTEPVQSLTCRVDAGVYHVAVLENGGQAGTYALDLSAVASSEPYLNCLSGLASALPEGVRATPGRPR